MRSGSRSVGQRQGQAAHQLREEAAHKGIASTVGVNQLLLGDPGHLGEGQGWVGECAGV